MTTAKTAAVETPRMTKRQAVKELSDKVEAIGKLVTAANEFADDYSIPFRLRDIDLYTDSYAEDNGWNSSNC